MAQRDYSPHQQKVIKRYYDNREQIDSQRLSELVTNLYLASEKKAEKLWVTANDLLERLKVPKSRIEHIMKSADPAILAEVVSDIESGKL
jgi:hypothetical protein